MKVPKSFNFSTILVGISFSLVAITVDIARYNLSFWSITLLILALLNGGSSIKRMLDTERKLAELFGPITNKIDIKYILPSQEMVSTLVMLWVMTTMLIDYVISFGIDITVIVLGFFIAGLHFVSFVILVDKENDRHKDRYREIHGDTTQRRMSQSYRIKEASVKTIRDV